VTVVADTGPLYALIDRSDAWHDRVLAWWKRNRAEIIVPVGVIPEVTYLLQSRIGVEAEHAFVRWLATDEVSVEQIEHGDLLRIDEIMRQYQDLKLGFVGASVVATAERLEAKEILTTDRRHFSAVRPAHTRAFVLFP
jgi:predicted nucleic acid-binding protein